MTAPATGWEVCRRMDVDSVELVASYFAALERGDIDFVRKCYAPGTRVWHDFDQVEYDGERHIEELENYFFVRYVNRRYIDVRTNFFAGGFVRQHVLTGLFNGVAVKIPICLVGRIHEGHIARIDEYLNSPRLSA